MTSIGLHSVDVKTLVIYFVSNVSLRNIWMIILTPSDLEGLWSLGVCVACISPVANHLASQVSFYFSFQLNCYMMVSSLFYSHNYTTCPTSITMIWNLVHFLYISFVSAVHTLINYPTMLPQYHCINLYWSIDFFIASITVSFIYLL